MVAVVNKAGESDVSNILSARTFHAGEFLHQDKRKFSCQF